MVASDAKRIIYDARASCDQRADRDARKKGWEGRPLRGLPENDPLAATSRPAQQDTRRRKGKAKHDTTKDSGGRAHRRDRGGGVRRLHVPAAGDKLERRREPAGHGQRKSGERHDAEHPANASRESEQRTEAG